MISQTTARITRHLFTILLASAALCLATAQAQENLIKNGAFADSTDGKPADWKFYKNLQELSVDTTEVFGDSAQSLRIDIEADGGKKLGEIVQKVRVEPNTGYVISGDIKSSAPDIAWVEIKLIVGGSESERFRGGGRSDTTWETFTKEFNSGDANMVWVSLRYRQSEKQTGAKVWFANISLKPSSQN